jgi:citrate lyase synthetase
VVACIPNAQHWSLIADLAIGEFRYQESGLLDKTHLRWFTKKTIVELFSNAGFRIVEGVSRVFHEPERDRFLPLIGQLAKASGMDPAVAVNDAIPLQYVVRAVPV